ncbi:MAG: hypothetical protein HY717_00100 [Planctomycetes bacterium]|nr:hypothetical protein [Planctomycetota bacterium]
MKTGNLSRRFSLPVSPRAVFCFADFFFLLLFLFSLASFNGILSAWNSAQAQALKDNEIDQKANPFVVKIPSDLTALRTTGDFISVPIYFKHNGQSTTLHIGLDYDELLLRTPIWSLDKASGDAVADFEVNSFDGLISMTVQFNPERAVDREEVLVWLQFQLAPWLQWPLALEYAYRLSAALNFIPAETFFAFENGFQISPQLWSGSITIYLQDILELGSGIITPDRQIFTVPVYVTHLQAEPVLFTMGLDYDELSLLLLDVTPARSKYGALIDQIQWFENDGSQPGSPKAAISVLFKNSYYPQLLREHILDLHFEFKPEENGLPPAGVLNLVPRFLNLDGGGAVDQGPSADDKHVFIKEGHIYILPRQFIRGDPNGSRIVDLADVLAILQAIFAGSDQIRCFETADIDDNGSVDISDSILLLSHLYAGGAPPASPFPDLGPDPEGSPYLGCEFYEEPSFQLLPMEKGI